MKIIILFLVLLLISCSQQISTKTSGKQDTEKIQETAVKLEAKTNLSLLNQTPKIVEELKWGEPTNRIAIQAQEENKCMLFYFYIDHCPYCAVLEQTTLAENEVVNRIEKTFLPAKINIETSNIAQVFEIKTAPTLLFFASDGHLLLSVEGTIPKEPMLQVLDIVAKECNKPKETERLQEPF